MDDIIDVNTMFGPLPAAATDLSVDDLEAMMKRHAVRTCCTLSTLGMLLDPMAGNAATRAATSEHKSLIPVATMNPMTYFIGSGTVARFAAEGFKLVRFFPGEQGWEPDYAPFVALTQRLDEEGLPFMVDVDRPGVATRLVNALSAHRAPLILAAVDERTASEAVALIQAHPNVHLEMSHLLATGALRHVVEAVGAARILYGSSAPSRPMASALAVLRHAGLDDTQRAQVLGGNARALLGL